MRLKDRFDRGKRKPSTRQQRIGFAFFWLLVLAYAYFIPTDANFNTESHLYPAFAMVDRHTVRIDAYRTLLGDESLWHGHYYTDKAPGLSFLAVPVYAALRVAFAGHRGMGYQPSGRTHFYFPRDTAYLRYAITYVLVILPSAIFALLLWLFLCRFISTGWALLVTAAYALGTIAYVYSTWFFSHQIAAILLFGSFLLLYSQVRDKPPNRRVLGFGALAGLLAGYAIISEYPTIVIAGLVGLYLLAVASNKWLTALAFIAGMVPAAALNLGYNLAAFGKPLATGYMYVHSTMYRSHVQGGGPLGLANPLSYGVQPPSLNSLWQITFGPWRGIFLVSPVLLLFFVGVFFMWRRREVRPELWLCLGVVVLYFLVDASRGADQNGWAGGWSVASRHLTPMLPFMIVPIAFGLRNRRFRAAFLALGAISVVLMFMIVSTSDQFAYPDRNPLVHEMWRRFSHGKLLVDWGYFLGLADFPSLVPFLVLAGGLVARLLWLFRSAPAGESTREDAVPELEPAS